MTATVFFLLDAFRWDYLDAEITPFLKSCAEKGHHVERVIPSFGFCERAEILTGRTPAETGYFTAIGYDPEKSPYRNLAKWLRILGTTERLLLLSLYSRTLRKFLSMYVKGQPHGMSSYKIPLCLLPYFALTEDYYDHRDPRAFDYPTLLRFLEERGESYYYDSFTSLNFTTSSSDHERLQMALNAANENHAFYLIFISVPDVYGHRHGGDAPQTRAALHRMDEMLEGFVSQFEKRRPGSSYVFLGDHGMVDVDLSLDVRAELLAAAGTCGLRLHKDFVYFLDSTLCRVWFLTEKAATRFPAVLQENAQLRAQGVFVDDQLAEREAIPKNDRRYGDLIWWANPGVLISPDFFHRRGEEIKGMHGYDPGHSQSQGTCIVYGTRHISQVTPEITLSQVHDVLKACLVL